MIVNSSLSGINMHREKIAANMAEMERLGIEISVLPSFRMAVLRVGLLLFVANILKRFKT